MLSVNKLYFTSQIRIIEQAHGAHGLMEKAGMAAAELAQDLAEDGHPILVLAGPGNNGGDAFVAARQLRRKWHDIDVLFTGDATTLPVDAKAAFDAWLACGGKVMAEFPAAKKYGLVIDGLFGIGLARDLDTRHQEIVRQANSIATTILSLDIPSGLCGNTGRVLGMAIQADHTLTFIGLKPGLFTLEGPDHAGAVHITDLGIDNEQTISQGWLVDAPPVLPLPRRKNSHKGNYGSVGVLGGNTSMIGAALLTARSALLTGAGRVYAGLLAEEAPAVDSAQPELMLRSMETLLKLEHLTSLVVGPGMGSNGMAETALSHALAHDASLVLDADALHMLAARASLRKVLGKRRESTVLTPHPGEAAALLDCTVADIQGDRILRAQQLAEKFHAIVVLKGCGSIIAVPDGRWFINTSGNPGLSSAGMGDVLAGIIGGLAAQGMDLLDATLLGVHLHGTAADALVADGVGPVGLTATEVALEARNILNQWISGS